MAARNAAYDFSMFEPKRKPQTEKSKPKKENIIVLPEKELQKNSRPKIHPLKMLSRFMVLALILGALGSLVYGQVRLTELTEDMKTNAQLSIDNAGTYAKDKLGMRAAEQGQTEYITLSDGDKSEVLIDTGEENWFQSVWNWLAGLLS